MDAQYTPTSFALAALKAAELAQRGIDPSDAWRSATISVFPDSVENQKKSCPKSAFLGLAEAGHIAGIQPGKYTTSLDNKRYALSALKKLQADPTLQDAPNELWRHVLQGETKQHNGQMNVVIALWKAKKFACQALVPRLKEFEGSIRPLVSLSPLDE